MEDKAQICKLLLPVLQATRAGEDITGIEYTEQEYRETVSIYRSWGSQDINVTCDSGIAMIRDIIKRM